MATRDIYLKIERVFGYSTVEPELKVMPPKQYRRDCMRNPGHESTAIPPAEVEARRLTALVYREYVDPGYLVPKADKLVANDVNEPVFSRRVPSAFIYAHPGERLKIHVLNGDSIAHSFHIHGLRYGIDSDGSWPFGTQSSDGRRSDEICPNQSWTYTFDVTDEMVGAWPFHDHSRTLGDSIKRGLFGGLVVRTEEDHERRLPDLELPSHVDELLRSGRRLSDAEAEAFRESVVEWALQDEIHPRPQHPDLIEVPIFLHFMQSAGGTPAFDSGPLAPGAPAFEVTFGAAGTFGYHCNIHPFMQGSVTVVAGAPALATVTIRTTPDMKFDPPAVSVAPGGKVQWTNVGPLTHTVTEDAAGMPSYCLNGRTFVGNTPTVVAQAGQRIRWYVFNLDLGEVWHNFHTHGQRWQFAGQTIDVRSISPAESFVVDTTAPPVLLLPDDIEEHQPPENRLPDAKPYQLRGDFLVHCHVEMHMGQGLAGLVRSRQTVWLTPAQVAELEQTTGLPIDPGDNSCPAADMERCAPPGCGQWQEVAGAPEVTMMHAALLPNTEQVLYWGYHRPDQSRIWDYGTPAGAYSVPPNQPGDADQPGGGGPPGELFNNLHSAGHAFVDNAEGTLLAHGGESQGNQQSLLFHPSTLRWEQTAITAGGRFYPSTLTLHDGKLLTIFGGPLPGLPEKSIEVYDPASGTWSAPKPLPATFDYVYYPWTYLLPGGDLFIAGHEGATRRFDWTPPVIVDDPARTWNTIAGDRSPGGGEKGTSVLLPLRAPAYAPRVLIATGNSPAAQHSAEMIDLSAAAPAWTALPDLNVDRPEQCTACLLPDGKVFLAGGVPGAPGPAELFDPDNPQAGWLRCADMKHVRGYHSSNILLADGSVLMGGDPSGAGGPTPHERYFPGYFSQPRPVIAGAPATVAHGAAFQVQTPNATSIGEAVLIRPGAVTHGWNQSQRFVGCAITGTAAGSVDVLAPPDGNVAPPGHYLLFIVDAARVPSIGRWIRVTP
jgi:FtsP/CotA-like multicopper oxidase with cupredoxin domain